MAKSGLVKPLGRALEALERDDDEAALEALLVAWRGSRSPRIADVIDRVSERLVAEDGPVTGKTVKARTEAWFKLALSPTARHVGRLLATPWPAKWADAVPMVEALAEVPIDPRIATALAKLVADFAWDSMKSNRVYARALEHLGALADARTISLLEPELERSRSYYWEQTTKPNIARTVARIRAACGADPDALDEKDEAALAPVLARFARDVSTDQAAGKSEEELLAAIYAAPDDDLPRAVYADWLTERGDPRGELIALQLATGGSLTEQIKREKRVAALLKKQGLAWAGPLDRFLHREGRRFERGFVARGSLAYDPSETLPRGFDDPAWATVKHLGLGGIATSLVSSVLAVPSLQGLRSIGGLSTVQVAQLPRRPAVEELSVHGVLPEEANTPFANSASFPNLRRLVSPLRPAALASLLRGALGRQLEVIVHRGYDHDLGPLARLVDELGLANVAEVQSIREWRMSLRRDASGRFSIVHGVRDASGRGVAEERELVRALQSFEAHEVTSITIDGTEGAPYNAEEIRRLEAELARFTQLAHVDVPWERLGARAKDDSGEAVGVLANLAWPELDATMFETTWRAVTAPPLSLAFDAYEVNHGAHQSLHGDGLAALQKVLAKKRTNRLRVHRKDGHGRLELDVRRYREPPLVHMDIDGAIPPDAGDRYIEWFAQLADALRTEGHVSFARRTSDGTRWEPELDFPWLTSLGRPPEWVVILEPHLDERIPFTEIEAIAARSGWLRTRRTKRTLMLVFGRHPGDHPPIERVAALEAALLDAFWTARAKKLESRPQTKIVEIFGPILEKQGFARHPLPDIADAEGKVVFSSHAKGETRWIYVQPDLREVPVTLWFHALHSRTNANADLFAHDQVERQRTFGPEAGARTPTDAKSLQKVLMEAAEDLQSVVPWFDQR